MKVPFLIASKGSNISESAVQAFAKLTGENWVFYVQDFTVSIGRSSNPKPGEKDDDIVDLDLGESKIISRRHARIAFNFTTRGWELFILGRNGLKINNILTKLINEAIPLETNTMLEIGGNQFMFTLPNTPEEEQEKVEVTPFEEEEDVEEKPKKHLMVEKAARKFYPRENPPPNLVKPTPSYAILIAEAINTTHDKKMTLASIYNYIADNYEYYQYANNGWQNSVRHNLSLNKGFKKVPREASENGKGMHWTIDPDFEGSFDDPKKRPRLTKDDEMVKRMRMGHGFEQAPVGFPMWNLPVPQPPPPFWGYNPYPYFDPASQMQHGFQPRMKLPVTMPQALVKKPDNLGSEAPLKLPSAVDLMKKLPTQYFRLRYMDDEPSIIPKSSTLAISSTVSRLDPTKSKKQLAFHTVNQPQMDKDEVDKKPVITDEKVKHINIKVGSETDDVSYATKTGKDIATMKFNFEGKPVGGNQTPNELDMEDDDKIEVLVGQTGGN